MLWQLSQFFPLCPRPLLPTFSPCNIVHMHGCYIYNKEPPQTEFIYTKLCIYSYMFKLQSPSKYSTIDAIHLSRHFFLLLKQFWTQWFLCLLLLLPFLFYFFNTSKTFPLRKWGLFSSRETNKQKSLSEQDQVNREGGMPGSSRLWSKTAKHSLQCGQVHS